MRVASARARRYGLRCVGIFAASLHAKIYRTRKDALHTRTHTTNFLSICASVSSIMRVSCVYRNRRLCSMFNRGGPLPQLSAVSPSHVDDDASDIFYGICLPPHSHTIKHSSSQLALNDAQFGSELMER